MATILFEPANLAEALDALGKNGKQVDGMPPLGVSEARLVLDLAHAAFELMRNKLGIVRCMIAPDQFLSAPLVCAKDAGCR